MNIEVTDQANKWFHDEFDVANGNGIRLLRNTVVLTVPCILVSLSV